MSNNQSVEKLKVDIKHKLSTYPSLGSSVDEELADYVLLMLANRRTKYVAKDELSLFLKDLTNDFVDWLYDRIKDIPFKALCQSASSELVKKSEEELPSSSTSSKSKSRKGSDYVGNSVKSPERRRRGRKRRAGEDLTQSLSLDKPNLTYNPSRSIDTTSMIEATQHEEYSPKPIVKEEEPQAEEIYRTEDQEVVLHLRTDINENDELLDETNEEPIFELDKDERPKHAVKLARERFSQGLDSMNHGLPSTVGAVVNRSSLYGEEEEDEDNTHNRHNVASIIQVYERKSSVPKNLQANPKMVMRAVEEATRSTDNVIRGKRKMADMELDMDIPYTPTPIKRRLGLRMNEEYYGERVDTENVEHYYDQTARSRITEYDPQRSDFDSRYQDYEYENTPGTHNPRFIVTLEGASRLRKDRNDRIVYDDELLFDEEMDEEFQENDDSFANHNLSDMSDLRGKERCKYWPSCKNGNRCLFHHPSSPCRAFPNCKFGDKCLFIHPDCKFDALCTRSDCPYTHTSKRQVPLVPVKPIIAPTFCRYNANCVNPTCPFLHSFPKPCNFGASCRNSNCPFSHPPSFNQFKSLPKPHQLKWKSSERKFAVEDEAVESMPVEIETEKSTS